MRIQLAEKMNSADNRNDPRTSLAYAARLARQKGLLEIVFNTIQEGVLVIDDALRIKYHNQAAVELLGLPEDLKRVKLSQFLKEMDWSALSDPDSRSWGSVSRREIEILYPCHRWLQFYMVPHERGSHEATVILQDVSEMKKETSQYIESETLRMVSMLAAGVAHEIGNPLNSIYLNLQLMKRNLVRGTFDPEDFVAMVDVAKDEVERLDGIIRQFLAALRPGKPKFTSLSLSQLAVESGTAFREEALANGVDLKVTVPAFFPLVNGDAAQLKQVILNLLKNALQATASGGEIEMRCYTEEDRACLEVRDTGSGIVPEELGRIFDPFHTTKKTGTGLGLMVVERVIREHGAEIRLKSEPGIGTVFTLRFSLCGRIRVPPMLPPVPSNPIRNHNEKN